MLEICLHFCLLLAIVPVFALNTTRIIHLFSTSIEAKLSFSKHSYISSSRAFILREYQKPRSKITNDKGRRGMRSGREAQEPRGERKLKSKIGEGEGRGGPRG